MLAFNNLNAEEELMGTNSCAVVTGAAGGIGKAICTELAIRGHTVFALDKNENAVTKVADELSDAGYAVNPVALDLTNNEAIDGFASTLDTTQILVNNAGVFDLNPFTELGSSDFQRHFDVNVQAPAYLTKQLLPLMKPGSAILNIASVAMNGARNGAHYAVSKAGLVALTKTLAIELAPSGIRVNAVAPGAIDTPMLMAGAEEAILPFIPLGRFGEPDDIAGAVGFLTSQQAKYITGVTLVVDGGVTLGG